MKISDLQGVALLALLPAGITACFTGLAFPAGIPLLVVAGWILYHGRQEDNEIIRRMNTERETEKKRVEELRPKPPPLPWRTTFKPSGGAGSGPDYDSQEYTDLWTRELRVFLRNPRNRYISRKKRPHLRGAIDYVWRQALNRNEYLTPSQVLNRARGLLVRQGHL